MRPDHSFDRVRNLDRLPANAPLSVPEVAYVLGISRTTLWRRVRDGSLPKPAKLLGRVTFRVRDVRALLS